MWNCPYSNDSFPSYAEDIDGGSSQSAAALSEAAKQHGITLVGGSIPERSEGNLYNTCLVYSKDGKLLAKHRKVGFCAHPRWLIIFLAMSGHVKMHRATTVENFDCPPQAR